MEKTANALTTQGGSIIKVEEFTSIMQNAPDILQKNRSSVENCNNAGKTLLDTIEGNGGITSDELDAKVSAYIDKTRVTVKNMNARRSPLTQLLTRVSKEFTTLENEINPTSKDSISAKLQAFRNKYAAMKLEEQKKIEEAERRRQAIESEKNEYRGELPLSMQKYFSFHFETMAVELSNLFTGLTLDNFEENSKKLIDFEVTYDSKEHFKSFKDDFRFVHLTEDDVRAIKAEIVPRQLKQFENQYKADLQGMKDDLAIRLNSKKKELEKIAELEKQDAEAAERAKQAQKERESEEERKREEERKKREQEEKARLEAQASQADIFSSFNQTAAAVPTSIPDAKVTKKIKVNNPKGFLEVYQMWFVGEGSKLSIAELEKVHKKMLTFCERKANKDDEFIQSAFVEYVDEVKAK